MPGGAEDKRGEDRDLFNIGVDIKIEPVGSEAARISQKVELLYLLEGRLCVTFQRGTAYMDKNDVLIINSGEPNSFTSISPGVLCRMLVDRNVFDDFLHTENYEFECDSTTDRSHGRFNELRRLLNELLRSYLENDARLSFMQFVMYFQILDIITANFLKGPSDGAGAPDGDYQGKRVQKAVRYVQENYNKQLSLTELADMLYVTDSHLSRVLKKELGVGFREYVNRVRLQHAVDDLAHTDKSIIRISNDNGFSGVAMFNKVFKETYGKSPSSYKKELKAAKEQEQIRQKELEKQALAEVENYLEEYNENQSTRIRSNHISVVTDVSRGERCPRPWIEMINVGTALELLNYKTQKHLLKLKSELDFTYVRFWGLFQDGMMMLSRDKNVAPNFGKLDDILDFLLGNRLRPFIQIGPKPGIITQSPNLNLLSAESAAILDISEEQWEELLNAMVRHMVSRYGGQEVESWIFEMWSPCRWDGKWFGWYNERRFAAVYRAIKRYVPNAMVGGCEFAPSEHSDRMDEISESWRNMGIDPDFISYSGFPYYMVGREGDKLQSRWLTDPDNLSDIINQARSDMKAAGLEDKKLFITTWNNTISVRNVLNDSVFKGAYIIKNCIDTLGKVDMLGYWLSTDSGVEYFDSTLMLFGGPGLLSKDGMPKPALYAFSFLKRLRSLIVERGANYIVSKNTHDTYTIVYHNMKTLNYTVYLKQENELSYEELDTMFDDKEAVTISLLLKNIEDGIYNIRVQKVNAQSGSILDEWHRLGAYHELASEDLAYLNQIAIPRKKMFRVAAENRRLELEVSAQPNEFGVIEIFPASVNR